MLARAAIRWLLSVHPSSLLDLTLHVLPIGVQTKGLKQEKKVAKAARTVRAILG